MAFVLIHNPSCSTSRKGLALLQENGIEPQLRKYMNVSEHLGEGELREIARQMGEVSPRMFMRTKEGALCGIDDSTSDDAIFAAMAQNPKLIQRPIGIQGDRAVLGRPHDRLLEIL